MSNSEAGMSTSKPLDRCNFRQLHLKDSSGRKSGQYSDVGEDQISARNDLAKSASLTALSLHSRGASPGGRQSQDPPKMSQLETLEAKTALSLHSRGASPGGRQSQDPPKMSQLETLEAKMASIEVSLSSTPRRKRGGSVGGSACGSVTGSVGAGAAGRGVVRELDALRTALRDKESVIHSLKEQLSTTISINRISQNLSRPGVVGLVAGSGGGCGGGEGALSEEERRALDERAERTKQDMDDKRTTIKNLKLALEMLDITDNIDVRIQQAELEYQLGREELELLTLVEHSRALQLLVEQADAAANNSQDHQSLYGCLNEMKNASIHAVEADYDPKSPRFGAGPRRSAPGLWVEWALDHSGVCKGDRLVEVNGVSALYLRAGADLRRLLSISPAPAQLVVLRAPATSNPTPNTASMSLPQVVSQRSELGTVRSEAREAHRAKDANDLRADNLRLTHRISYLEEQVAELLTPTPATATARHAKDNKIKVISTNDQLVTSTVKTKKNITNISITSEPQEDKSKHSKSDIQVFQKGPDITAIVANLPGLAMGAHSAPHQGAPHNLPLVRPKSNLSNISSTHISIGSPKPNRAGSITSVAHTENEKTTFTKSHARHNHKNHKHTSEGYPLQSSRSSHSLDHKIKEKYDTVTDRKSYRMRQSISQHCILSEKGRHNVDYQKETDDALEVIKRNQKHYKEHALHKELKHADKSRSDDNFDIRNRSEHDNRKSISHIDFYDKKESRPSSGMNGDFRSTENFDDQKSKARSWAERKSLSIIEQLKQSQRLRKSKSKNKSVEAIDFDPERDYVYQRIDGKVIENTHKSNRRMSKLHSRSGKSLDNDSENSDFPNGSTNNVSAKIVDYASEPGSVKTGYYKKHTNHSVNGDIKTRPMPPKKPLRLSLHRAHSARSVDSDMKDSDNLSEINTNISYSDRLKIHYTSNNKINSEFSSENKHTDYQSHLEKKEKELNNILDDYRYVNDNRKRNHKGDTFSSCEQHLEIQNERQLSNHNNQNDFTSTKSTPSKKYTELRHYQDKPHPDEYNKSSNLHKTKENFQNQQNYPSSPNGLPASNSTSATSNHGLASAQSAFKWKPSTPIRNGHDTQLRYNGHILNNEKWC